MPAFQLELSTKVRKGKDRGPRMASFKVEKGLVCKFKLGENIVLNRLVKGEAMVAYW